jgi:glycosyltransferase involved in cell wall biosynthesis
LRVCIPGMANGIGGPNSFRRYITKGLNDIGIDVIHQFSTDVDVVLLIGGTKNFKWLDTLKTSDIPIVQRLGPINWLYKFESVLSKHYWMSRIRNNILFKIQKKYANYNIYQSNFCAKWWHDELGDSLVNQSIIYNSVDISKFPPVENNRSGKLKLIAVEGNLSYTSLVNKIPITLINRLNEVGIDSTLTLVGDLDTVTKNNVKKMPNVDYLGVISNNLLHGVLSKHNIFISSEILPACPNSPLEAMSTGLPVVGFDTGALSELVRDNAGLCANYGADPWLLDLPNYNNLVDAVRLVDSGLDTYSKNAVSNINKNFTLSKMTEEYVKVFKTLT